MTEQEVKEARKFWSKKEFNDTVDRAKNDARFGVKLLKAANKRKEVTQDAKTSG